MSQVNACVVGAGIYGRHHINAYSHSELVKLVAVCEVNESVRDFISSEFGVPVYPTLEELFNHHDVDIVSITTPDPYHFEPTAQAITSGKHVLIEKPLATTVEECERIIELSEQYHVKVGVDFHKRWDGMTQNIHEQIKSGEAGRVVRGYISMDDVIDWPLKNLYWAKDSSPVYFLGSHCFDQIRFYMNGANAIEVYAIGQKGILQSKGVDTYDTVQTFVTFDNGSQWTVETGWILPGSFPKANDGRSYVITERKYFRADAQYRGYEVFSERSASTPNYNFINYSNGIATGYGIAPIHDFIQYVINDKPFLATAYDGLQSAIICDAAHRSLSTGKSIKL